MFWLYFVAGHFVTGLVLVLLASLLTWHRPDRSDIRHGLVYGYLNLLHAPIIVYLRWAGQIDSRWEEPGEDNSTDSVQNIEARFDDEAEAADESGSAPA